MTDYIKNDRRVGAEPLVEATDIEKDRYLDNLRYIADVSRQIARLSVRFVRGFTLSSPARPFIIKSIDRKVWFNANMRRGLEIIADELEGCAVPLSIEFVKKRSTFEKHQVADIYILRRIERELSMLSAILDDIDHCSFIQRRPEDETLNLGVSSRTLMSPDRLLSVLARNLESFWKKAEPMMSLWADSQIFLKPGEEMSAEDRFKEAWNVFSELLPGVPVPGEAHESLIALDRLFGERSPWIPELFRIEEATFVMLTMAVLLYCALQNASNVPVERLGFLEFNNEPEGNLGWSGGDGLPNVLNRILLQTVKSMRRMNEMLRLDSTVMDFSNVMKVSQKIWSARTSDKPVKY